MLPNRLRNSKLVELKQCLLKIKLFIFLCNYELYKVTPQALEPHAANKAHQYTFTVSSCSPTFICNLFLFRLF